MKILKGGFVWDLAVILGFLSHFCLIKYWATHNCATCVTCGHSLIATEILLSKAFLRPFQAQIFSSSQLLPSIFTVFTILNLRAYVALGEIRRIMRHTQVV